MRCGDVLTVAMRGAIGYTVSLLIARLAIGDVAAQERAAASVLIASVSASAIAVLLLRHGGQPEGAAERLTRSGLPD